jgi:hypothetical protein
MMKHQSDHEAPKRRQALGKAEQQIRLATVRAYFNFCHEYSTYPHNVANYFTIMDWIDERRIEMEAEGRRYWVPSDGDFWKAVRDCWDDLLKPEIS